MQSDLRESEVPKFNSVIRSAAGSAKPALIGWPIRDLEDPRARVAWEDYRALGNEVLEIIA